MHFQQSHIHWQWGLEVSSPLQPPPARTRAALPMAALACAEAALVSWRRASSSSPLSLLFSSSWLVASGAGRHSVRLLRRRRLFIVAVTVGHAVAVVVTVAADGLQVRVAKSLG